MPCACLITYFKGIDIIWHFSEFILWIYPVQQDLLDPPEDFFRIRMIVTLLQTCGHYFDRGSSKRKLDRFLLHFQRYILNKGPLPLDVEFDVQVSVVLNASNLLDVASLKHKCMSSLHCICKHMVRIQCKWRRTVLIHQVECPVQGEPVQFCLFCLFLDIIAIRL